MEFFDVGARHMSMILWDAADIVQHSFIVQHSISPLNLELCQSIRLWEDNMPIDYPSFTYTTDMMATEEKCRKVHSDSRDLLYTLHLDLPRDSERSLKIEPKIFWPNFVKRHKAKVFTCDYTHILSRFIKQACKSTGHNPKIVKWLLKFDGLEKFEFLELSKCIIEDIIKCMPRGPSDLEFVRECFRKFDFINWLVEGRLHKPRCATFLLYQYHRIGGNVENVMWITNNLTMFFNSLSKLQLVDEVLKFKDSPNFCGLFDTILQDLLLIGDSLILKRTTISRQRHSLLLLVFWLCLNSKDDPPRATEYLRLIWSSVPDSHLSFNEIETAFVGGFSETEISEVYNFYSEAVGGLNSYLEPRYLKHYCRIAIRRRLYENRHWLSEAIRETGLPEKLQSYLNLEE